MRPLSGITLNINKNRLNTFENGKTQLFNSGEVVKWAYFQKNWSIPLKEKKQNVNQESINQWWKIADDLHSVAKLDVLSRTSVIGLLFSFVWFHYIWSSWREEHINSTQSGLALVLEQHRIIWDYRMIWMTPAPSCPVVLLNIKMLQRALCILGPALFGWEEVVVF